MARDSYFTDGFILGAIVGAVLGVLFAPSEGKETRRSIKRFTKTNEDKIEETREKVEDLIEKTKSSIEQGFENLGSIIDNRKSAKAESETVSGRL